MSAARVQDVSDLRFWKGSDPHTKVFAVVDRIRRRTSSRREMDLYHACLYDDSELAGLGPYAYTVAAFEPSTLAFNVIRQNVDTLTAKIAKSRPLPMAVTTGGNYSEQRRAKKFNSFVEGSFDEAEVWRTSRAVARDAALFGTGIAYSYRVGNKIHHERVFPWEVLVDPREAMYGNPRTIYLRRHVDRLVLTERFPKFAQEIESASSTSDDEKDIGYDSASDLVLVVEAWHLPSGEDADDGSHVIAISNETLLREDYTRDRFPLSVLRMSEPLMGWYGTGLGKMLTGLQYTINDMAARVQEEQALSGGYVLVEQGSDVVTEHIDNGSRTILKYRGTPPQWISPQPVHPDKWNFVLTLIPKASEMSGVSQLSSSSQIPAGLQQASGKALQVFDDIESERFLLFSRAYEDYHIDVAWQFFDLADEIANDNAGHYRVRSVVKERGQRTLQDVDFKDVRIDKESFKLFVFPTSLLAKTPAARMQQVQQLSGAGWISPSEAKMLLDFPDLERTASLSQAARDVVESLIERFLSAEDPEADGVYVYPEPFFDLGLCVTMGQQAYLRAKLEGVPNENLALLRGFVVDAQNEVKKLAADVAAASQPPPSQQAPPGMAPPVAA